MIGRLIVLAFILTIYFVAGFFIIGWLRPRHRTLSNQRCPTLFYTSASFEVGMSTAAASAASEVPVISTLINAFTLLPSFITLSVIFLISSIIVVELRAVPVGSAKTYTWPWRWRCTSTHRRSRQNKAPKDKIQKPIKDYRCRFTTDT